MNLLELTLGILTAVGGFVDVSEMVFMSQAGSRFGYSLIWVVIFATVGIIVFAEMSGRIAAMSRQPLFALVRHRLGPSWGLLTLAASLVATLITCAAEIGGVALVLELLTGGPYPLMAIAATAAFLLSIWFLPFKWIERTYGLLGLFMVVFGAALVAIDPPWGEIARGAIPQVPQELSQRDLLAFGYFVVALTSAIMFPYEISFYSSGGVEEDWSSADLGTNRVTSILGMGLGSVIAIAILAMSAQMFAPRGISPEMIATVVMQPGLPYGKLGILLALLGMLFAFAGAAIETCLGNAYAVCQFFGWRWGRHCHPRDTPLFTIVWIILFLLALAIVATGVEPVELADYAVVSSIIVLPLSYLPLLLTANDRNFMRDHANGPLANTLGWLFYGVVCLAALAALPLYFLTRGGQL